MVGERFSRVPMTHVKQSYEMGCVPTGIAMTLSGYGLQITEKQLIDGYFPTAALPASNIHSGTYNHHLIRGVVRIVEDLGLNEKLQVDTFEPSLYKEVKVDSDKYIVKCSPHAAREYVRFLDTSSDVRMYYQALAELGEGGKVEIYTANPQKLGIRDKQDFMSPIPDERIKGFYQEFIEFVQKGHVMGPHGGTTRHFRVIDTTLSDANGFSVLDPNGTTYQVPYDYLVRLTRTTVTGDFFDRIIRISPRECL